MSKSRILTGHVDFALDGYEFKPLAFLIKPVNPLRLERVLFQAEELLGKTERKPRRIDGSRRLLYYVIIASPDDACAGRFGQNHFI